MSLRPLHQDYQPATTVRYSPKPLPQAAPVYDIPVSQFEGMVARRNDRDVFHYVETMMMPADIEVDEAYPVFVPPDGLVVCDMGETGFGVYTERPYRAGDVVCVYAAECISNTPRSNKNLSLLKQEDLSPEPIGGSTFTRVQKRVNEEMSKPISERKPLNPMCDASHYGGVGSLMQSLPVSSALVAEEKKIIAAANLKVETRSLSTKSGQIVRFAVLKATCDIVAGSQLGFDYDLQLEAMGISPLVFDKLGNAWPQEMLINHEECIGLLDTVWSLRQHMGDNLQRLLYLYSPHFIETVKQTCQIDEKDLLDWLAGLPQSGQLSERVVDELVKAGYERDHYPYTAMFYLQNKLAVRQLCLVKRYKKYGSSLAALPRMARIAAVMGDESTLCLLLRLRVNINEPGPATGVTALHKAREKGRASIVSLLLHHGANPIAKSTDGAVAMPLEEAVVLLR
jgi:hypothetical protein